MTNYKFEQVLNHYAGALEGLEREPGQPAEEQILEALSARDALYQICTVKPAEALHGAGLARLAALDLCLKKQEAAITRAVKLDVYRGILNPPPAAWWWYFRPKETRVERFSWVSGAVALLLLTISLSLLSDLVARFLSGGPDLGGILLVITQTALTFIFTGGVVTKTGREGFDKILKSFAVPEKFWQWIRLGAAVAVFAILIGVRLSLPGIAVLYNNEGMDHFRAGEYASAQYDFERALKLYPEYIEVRYNLASLLESLGDTARAKTEYKTAVLGGLDAANNNLARLYILEKNYDLAIPLLLAGLDKTQDAEIRYDLNKNLGWARLGQNRLEEAKTQLRAAISIKEDAAPAHCLLAQVLSGLKLPDEAAVEWNACLKYADGRRPDEDAWIYLARTNLVGSKP